MKAGDVVYSRTSGVTMTVEKIDGDRVACVWFGISAWAFWTGPHRKSFARNEITRSKRSARRIPPTLGELKKLESSR